VLASGHGGIARVSGAVKSTFSHGSFQKIRHARALAPWSLRYHHYSMIDEPDIWRAANLLMRHHGSDAALVAARRSDESLSIGNVEGCAVWKRILEAVAELSRTKPVKGERAN
jgi:hypothetical protein